MGRRRAPRVSRAPKAKFSLKSKWQGDRGGGREARDGHPCRVGQVGHQLPHLLQRVALHQDVVLGQEERRDLAELPDGGRVGVGDDVPQIVKSVIEIVHPPPLPRVYGEALVLEQKAW